MGKNEERLAVAADSRLVRLNQNLVVGWTLLFILTIGLAAVATIFKPSTEPVTQIFAGALLLAEIVFGARAIVRYRRLRLASAEGSH